MRYSALKPLVAVAAVIVAVTGLAVVAQPPKASQTAPPPTVAPLDRILIAKDAEVSLIDPTGTAAPRPLGRSFIGYGLISPTGDRLVVNEWPKEIESWPGDKWPPFRAVIRRTDGTGDPAAIPKLDPAAEEHPMAVRWSADGRRLLVTQVRSPRGVDGHAEKVGHWEYDPASGKATEIRLPDGHHAVDWTADGRRLLLDVTTTTAAGGRQFRMALFDRRTEKVEPFGPADRSAHPIRFAPDGVRVLYAGHDAEQYLRLRVLDTATGKETTLTDPAAFWSPNIGGAWSPDGRRIAFARKKRYGGTGDDAAANVQVVVCDADGSDPKVIAARTLMGEPAVHTNGFAVLDWR